VIVTVSPSSLTTGATSVTLTVLGGGFVSGSTVEWNGVQLTTTFVSATKLTAAVPDLLVYTQGTTSITVVSPTPGGGTSNVAYLPVDQPESSMNFGAGTSVPAGNQPLCVAAGDFNGDGIADLAVGNAGDNTVSILLGNGDGTFTSNGTVSIGSVAIAIAVADFNGDGIPDLAIANNSSGSISVLLNDGHGNFTVKSTPTVGQFPAGIAVGDFNGDGYLDMVSTNQNGTDLFLLLGNGDGTFTAGTAPPNVSYAAAIVGGDFNEDGKLDIAVSDSNGIEVLLGNGNGTFQTPSIVSFSANYRTLAVADFNKDGHLDLADTSSENVVIYLGDGAGAFTLASTTDTTQYADGFGMLAGDFNGDGNPDVIVGLESFFSWPPVSVYILPGGGDGTLGTAQFIGGGNAATYQMAAADFNDDGELDVAFPVSSAASVYVQVVPVAFAPASLPFPAEHTGAQSVAIPVTLTNNTGGSLSFSSISVTGADTGDFIVSNDTCSAGVASSSTCSVSVAFAPMAGGARTALLTFVYGGSLTATVPLSGLGIQSIPTVTLSPSGLTFSSQAVGTPSGAQPVTLSVTNSVGLNITSIAITGANSGDFTESDNCGTGVAGNSSCTINVKFQPTDVGSRSAFLTVTDSAGDSPESVALSGTGSADAAFSITVPTSAVTIERNVSMEITVTIPSEGGTFSNPVVLSISGLPSGATASFNPSSVVPGANGATSTLTLYFPSSARGVPTGDRKFPLLPATALALSGLIFVVWSSSRGKLSRTLAAVACLVVLAASLVIAGCGSAQIPPETLNVIVTGVSGGVQHSATLDITLE